MFLSNVFLLLQSTKDFEIVYSFCNILYHIYKKLTL
nr:MAG TPA: hypothetical protein [Caudoviricetes sp.]